jgi:YesN/AraC family two-component response regulator
MARLLVQLDREYSSDAAPSAQGELVTLVQEYLRAHFSEQISLAALAEQFHVNLPYLTRLFKRTIGVAPVRYLRDLRIAHARKLLQEKPDLEIKEIGPMAGYPDPGYFSRIFRMSVGMGPQEYREKANHDTKSDETITKNIT